MRQEREVGAPPIEAQARRLLDEVAAELATVSQPVATYRVQLHKGFGFRDAPSHGGVASTPLRSNSPGTASVTNSGTAQGDELLAGQDHLIGGRPLFPLAELPPWPRC